MSFNSEAPFVPQTHHDHRAQVWVTGLICLSFVVITVFTRFYVRRKALVTDDYAIFVTTNIGLVQSAIVFAGLLRGLGVSTYDLGEEKAGCIGWVRESCRINYRRLVANQIMQVSLASEAIFVLTTCLSKTAVLLTIERLLSQDMKSTLLACRVMHALVAVCGISSILAITVRCSSSALLTQHMQQSCTPQVANPIHLELTDSVY